MDVEEEIDPFEARLAFLSLLKKLTASQQSIHKATNFAIKFKSLYEDLYSCIIEELDQASFSSRLNLLYILDSICHQTTRMKFTGYVELVRKDLNTIVNKVVPDNAKGNVNLPSARKVLSGWKMKGIAPAAAIEKIEQSLSSRDIGDADSGLSKTDILKRMEEDRERHKKMREENWVCYYDQEDNGKSKEFSNTWETTSDLNEQDLEMMESDYARFRSDTGHSPA
ncbi:hypothetical protein K7432_000504 [Basidiobolus ranarum]|uniref:CID domain-containing protein n=1 Tax=Basidiobolus ranarum TaxID=34480 RepID=A0ABR2X4H9_9FUNG